MNKQLVEHLAKRAANDFVKSANFDFMEMLKQLFSQGSSMFQGMDLKSMMPYMGMAAPLFKGVGSVAGIPGIAGMLDTFRGGQNLQTLTAGGFGQYGQQATSAPQPAGQGQAAPGQPAPQSTPAPNNAPIQPNTPQPAVPTQANPSGMLGGFKLPSLPTRQPESIKSRIAGLGGQMKGQQMGQQLGTAVGSAATTLGGPLGVSQAQGNNIGKTVSNVASPVLGAAGKAIGSNAQRFNIPLPGMPGYLK